MRKKTWLKNNGIIIDKTILNGQMTSWVVVQHLLYLVHTLGLRQNEHDEVTKLQCHSNKWYLETHLCVWFAPVSARSLPLWDQYNRVAVNCGRGLWNWGSTVFLSIASLCSSEKLSIKLANIHGFFGHRFYKPVHTDVATRFYNLEADEIASRGGHADADCHPPWSRRQLIDYTTTHAYASV